MSTFQNTTREFAALEGSKARRHADWTTRKALPGGYTVHIAGSYTGPTSSIATLAERIQFRADRGQDTGLTLWCGATELGTVSIEAGTAAEFHRQAGAAGVEVLTRALVAHLWASCLYR